MGEKKMKKLIVLVASLLLIAGSSFAMDMNIILKGLTGSDNSQVNGALIGGGLDLNLDLKNGFGLEMGSNISTSKITSNDNGLNVANDLCINIPVMGWYNLILPHFGFGCGVGLDASITDNFKMALAGGVNAKWYVNDQFAVVFGATGVLDCFPTLEKTDDGSSSTYNFVESDFSHNAMNYSLGLEYRLCL